MEVTPEVARGHEAREATGEGGLDLAPVLAQLGLDEREVEERVDLGLRGERPELGGLAGERLAVLPDPEEALLGQAPAAVAGPRPEPDVVLLRACEVDEVRARLARAA